MILAAYGVPKCRIVISREPSSLVRYGAEELVRVLLTITGAKIPIVSDDLPPRENEILLGKSCRTQVFFSEMDSLPREGYFYRTEGDWLIFGGTGRGLLYGIYAFLEDELGCRFFTPEVTQIPRRNGLEIPALDRRGAPVMEYREPHIGEFRDGAFALRRRVNGLRLCDPAEIHGGGVTYAQGYFVHTLTKLLSPEEFFDTHPEYFAEIDGKRRKEKTQLCLSNPEVLQIVTQRVLAELRKQPEAGIFSVSQADNYNGCTCPKCRATDEEEGSMAGSLLRFVNRVAQAVEVEFPDVVIDTLAYQYTRKPPKITRPRENVCVRLCTIECCFFHSLRDCRHDDPDAPNLDLSQPFTDDLLGWGKICNRLYIWDYVTNFSHFWMPHPNFAVLAENLRFFAENGVKGVFEQGCPAVGGGEFTGLRSYLLSKLLWDPETDAALAMEEYLFGVYGPAAPYLKAYIREVHRAVEAAGCHLYCFNHPDKPWHTMALVERCEGIFDQAEKAAPDGTVLRRVQKERLAVRYLRILLTKKGSPERNTLLDAFAEDAKRLGITQLWEFRDLDFCLDVLRGREDPGYWWAG